MNTSFIISARLARVLTRNMGFFRGVLADICNTLARESPWSLVTKAEPSGPLVPATSTTESLTGVGDGGKGAGEGAAVAVAEPPAKRTKKAWKEIARFDELPSGTTIKSMYTELCNAVQRNSLRSVGHLATRLDGFAVQHFKCDLNFSHSCPFEARILLHHEKRVAIFETVGVHEHASTRRKETRGMTQTQREYISRELSNNNPPKSAYRETESSCQ